MFWAEPLRAHLLRLYVLLTMALLPFVVWPGLDLWASDLFFTAGAGFPMAGAGWAEALRSVLWALSILGLLAALVGLACSLLRPSPVPARVWGLIVAFFLAGPILLVHEVFKNGWHRLRPANVAEFGGTGTFTGPLAKAGACLDNCSFVSGEVAGTAALALALLWLLPVVPRRGARRAVAAIAIGMVLLSTVLRMGMGRHFLSDCLFAILLMFALWSLLSRLLPPGWPPFAPLRRSEPRPRAATAMDRSGQVR